MALNELLFVFAFLPACVLLYYLLPMRVRNGALLAASLAFFAWASPQYLVLLVCMTLANYFACRELDAHLTAGHRVHAGLICALTVIFDLLPLLLFKYYGAAAELLSPVLPVTLPAFALAAPVGVSFYTFSLISAVADVYCRRTAMGKSVVQFALYVTFFPKLVSGPIAQYADMADGMQPHALDWQKLGGGARLFIIGLSKKVLLAGMLGMPFYALQAAGGGNLSVAGAWLGAVLYALMLYFDFSGYSDMAVGAARLFGFELPPNFDYPYCAAGIADFWRRWHMSLGLWFRTYVYIPLGGSRDGAGNTCAAILIVWLLTGLWHGAKATFVVWGLYYAVLLVLEKFVFGKALQKIPLLLRRIFTDLLVLIGWVPFFSDSLGDAAAWLARMFSAGSAGLVDRTALYWLRTSWPVLLIAVFAALPFGCRFGNRFYRAGRTVSALSGLYFAALLLLCAAGMLNGTYSAFLYAQF